MATPSLWRQRNFLLVLGGEVVNNIGDWLLAVALPAYVYTETGSGTATAAIALLELAVSIVFGPHAGALVDRWDLRRTVIASNAAQAVTLLPLLAVDGDRIWPAWIVAVVQGVIREVNNPASFALVPRVVAAENLTTANAINGGAGSICRLVGAPLGGIAVAAGGLPAVVWADGTTFLVVAVTTWFVRGADTGPAVQPPAGTGGEPDAVDGREHGSGVRAGWRIVRRNPALRGQLVVQTIAAFGFAMFPVLFIAFVVDVLGGDEATIGIIRGMAALGGIGAALLVGKKARRVDPVWLMAAGFAGLGTVAFVFVNVSHATTALWLYLVLFALSGLPNITSEIGSTGATQRLCPSAVLGRFQGISSALGAAAALAATAATGVLVDHMPVRILLNVQAAVYVSAGVAAWLLVARRRTDVAADATVAA